ncbi:MAG: DUF1800 family protein [Anaerolineae bacterium]
MRVDKTGRQCLPAAIDHGFALAGFELAEVYPDVKVNWTASATMLARWNLGLAAVGAVDQGNDFLVPGFSPVNQMPELTTAGAVVDWWIDRLLHRPMLAADRGTLIDYLTKGGTETDPVASGEQRIKETVALILDSPYFQWR